MHIPVLKNEIIDQFDYLSDLKDGFFVDGTLGFAGHSLSLVQQYPKGNFKIVGIDKDLSAQKIAQDKIKKEGFEDRFIFIHDDFSNISEILKELGIPLIDGALIDLGVSSLQLDEKKRGFSFEDPNAPLDMRMDQSQKVDAKFVLNNYPIWDLEKILREYGEEKFAKNIAKNITKQRTKKHFETVGELLRVIQSSIPKKFTYGKKHFATNTFRALRMEVNNEVGNLEEAIIKYVDFLKKDCKLAIITFHSIEDRIVKNVFRTLSNPCTCPAEIPFCVCGKRPKIRILHKKPIVPTESEIKENPRSRSAKLRIVVKI